MIKQITFLGTGSLKPRLHKLCSSVFISTNKGNGFLFDCGEGTQMQFENADGSRESKISHIFITHLHGDHFFGLFSILAGRKGLRTSTPLTIYGPVGIKRAVNTIVPMNRHENVSFVELEGKKSIDLGNICTYRNEGFRISAHSLVHRVPTFGYVLEEFDFSGRFNIEKALKLGISNELRKIPQLKSGKDIVLNNNKVIKSSSVMGEKIKGKKFTFLQDTCNSDSAIEKAMDSDILVHECTFKKALWKDAKNKMHSTSEMAGLFAKKIRAKNLFLTHFSERHTNYNALQKEAERVCYGTKVWAAKDLMTIERVKHEFVVK